MCAGGAFQSNFSETYQVEVVNGFNWTLGNEVIATGDLATDIVQIGDIQIANMHFGVAKRNIAEAGGIGLGYGLNDGAAIDSPSRSFLQQLQAAGAIESRLYSLLLNSSSKFCHYVCRFSWDAAEVVSKRCPYWLDHTRWYTRRGFHR